MYIKMVWLYNTFSEKFNSHVTRNIFKGKGFPTFPTFGVSSFFFAS